MTDSLVLVGLSAVPVAAGLKSALGRLLLSKAKHPSLRGHSRIARFVASLVPLYEYGEDQLFRIDGAPADVEAKRKSGFQQLGRSLREKHPKSIAASAELEPAVSDAQFTSAYRIPFQFSRYVRERMKLGGFVEASSGVTLRDLDGNSFYDLTGSYGVNVFGNDFYKECMAKGSALVQELGPVLGQYHPVVAYNVKRLQQISGLGEVSFHMSGTEAVMQAVRLARYHSRKPRLVRFCGAYHGWWGDVQPGVGNPQPARDTYTLKEMDEDSLRVLRKRNDIACVLVNPLQALHPNGNAPSDSTLVDSGRTAGFDKAAYRSWLEKLRAVCTERGIALIFDEVFLGFRLAPGGAQEYFGIKADLVTYGKTVAGGFPVGVLCGEPRWMKRFRSERPADICFARGTFNSHPYIMGAMNEFLRRLETPELKRVYENLDAIWDARAARLNAMFRARGLPLEVKNLQSIWTLCYLQPGRYNWMLQYYLREAGILLSWIGTGRFIFSLNYTDADFEAVCARLIAGAQQMERDGFFWRNAALTNQSIQRSILKEMISKRL